MSMWDHLCQGRLNEVHVRLLDSDDTERHQAADRRRLQLTQTYLVNQALLGSHAQLSVFYLVGKAAHGHQDV